MAAKGEEIVVTLTFERPLTNEKLRERCLVIAEYVEEDEGEDDD